MPDKISTSFTRDYHHSTMTQMIATGIERAKYVVHDFWNEQGDPRVKRYPLMEGGPWPTILLILMYLYFVKVAGPHMMKGRKPFDLKYLIRGYNIALVGFNGWFCYTGIWLLNYGLDSWSCQPVDYRSGHPLDMFKIELGWLFTMSKFMDFCDTIFFVLRKKDTQITNLHVVHHSAMPLCCWLGVKFASGGNSAFFPFINSFVHTIMYAYYCMSTFPSLRSYLWWKPYITKLQMLQFVLLIAHSIYSMMIPGCHWPRIFMWMSSFNALLFLVMFYSFYQKKFNSIKTEPGVTHCQPMTPEEAPISKESTYEQPKKFHSE